MEANREYRFARLILKLGNTIIKNRDKHLRQIGLTTEQADSLQVFLYQGQATITELKDHLGVSHQTARGIVRRMEDKALVQIRKSDIDARCQQVIPTEQGREAGEVLRRNGTCTGSQLLRGLSEAEQKQFFNLLQNALKNIEN